MLEKAQDAFRTISEVADDLDLPQHVLRFWETRFSQIRPMKRSGGRRYYRPDDVELLRGIRHLLYGEGYTIRGVQRILREQGVKVVQAVGPGRPLPAQDTRDADADAAEALQTAPARPAPSQDQPRPVRRAPAAPVPVAPSPPVFDPLPPVAESILAASPVQSVSSVAAMPPAGHASPASADRDASMNSATAARLRDILTELRACRDALSRAMPQRSAGA